MHRLPQPDRNGGLLERAAFLALNAAALLLIGITLFDSARFAAGRQQTRRVIAAGAESPGAETSAVARQQPAISLKSTEQTAGAPKLHDPKS